MFPTFRYFKLVMNFLLFLLHVPITLETHVTDLLLMNLLNSNNSDTLSVKHTVYMHTHTFLISATFYFTELNVFIRSVYVCYKCVYTLEYQDHYPRLTKRLPNAFLAHLKKGPLPE